MPISAIHVNPPLTFGGWEEIMTHHTACQASSHESKADKEEETRAPDCTRVAKALFSTDAVLIDQVDDENAEERAQSWNPVCKGDVHGYRVVRLIVWWVGVRGEDGGIEESPKSE
jgi:hypothetical protein